MPDGRYPFIASVLASPASMSSPRGDDLYELLEWDAAWRVHAFDLDGALESCLALHHAARPFGDEPTIVAQLARDTGNSRCARALERVLAQRNLIEALMLPTRKGERGAFFVRFMRGWGTPWRASRALNK
jgi:hypothetical protein